MNLRYFSVGPVKFVRRPVRETPPDGTTCFVDYGHSGGWSDREIGTFKGGCWTDRKGNPLRFEPSYWIELRGRSQ